MKTPYLTFHEEKLIKNYKNFENACKKYFDKFQICFSIKTNSNPKVINSLRKLNSGFEVASLKEMKLAPKNSFKVINGPAKSTLELNLAIKEHILLQIDSFSEIEKISKLKIKPKEAIIRLGKENSKFGFSEKQIQKAIKKLENLKITFSGFQLHSGTLNKFKDFQNNLKKQKEIINPYLGKIKYLNFGGGYPDNFQLKNLSLKLEDYLKEIKNNFKIFKGNFIFEPGRNIVADTYTLTTKVITIKEKENKTYAILDAGINILSKISLANFKFNKLDSKKMKQKPKTNKVEKETKPAKTYILAGPLLFNNDLLGKWHGKLEEGDFFEVQNVGAYCENLAWNIIYDKVKLKH